MHRKNINKTYAVFAPRASILADSSFDIFPFFACVFLNFDAHRTYKCLRIDFCCFFAPPLSFQYTIKSTYGLAQLGPWLSKSLPLRCV